MEQVIIPRKPLLSYSTYIRGLGFRVVRHVPPPTEIEPYFLALIKLPKALIAATPTYNPLFGACAGGSPGAPPTSPNSALSAKAGKTASNPGIWGFPSMVS